MLVADFDGFVRDGATFQLKDCWTDLDDGDIVMFNYPDGAGAGINVEEDDRGLCAHIAFEPLLSFRIGLKSLGNGTYAFHPAPHHIELRPSLGPTGKGEKIG
jgi:hypothetical protein